MFDENELRRSLTKHNYYSLFNGFENLLLNKLNPKEYKFTTLADFEALYSFDKAVNVNIRMYNFDDVQCTVIPSVAYGFVTGMNLQLC